MCVCAANGPNLRIQKVIDGGLCRRVVELLLRSEVKVVSPSLRAVGNMLTGDDVQTQVGPYNQGCAFNMMSLLLVITILRALYIPAPTISCGKVDHPPSGAHKLLSATRPPAPPVTQQPGPTEGGLLGHLKRHRRQQGADTGQRRGGGWGWGVMPGCCVVLCEL